MELTKDSSGQEVVVRSACLDDYEAILEIWLRAGLRASTKGRESRFAFAQQLEQFPDLYLVAAIHQEVVGVVFGTHDHRKGWINRLAVLPAHQRQGIAKILLDACDQAIRNAGIDIVSALIEPDNEASIALFRRAGYVCDVPVIYFRKRSHTDV